MDNSPTAEVGFYLTVCACSSSNAKHCTEHNSTAAVRISELLNSAGFINDEARIEVSACCTAKALAENKPSHNKHYVLIKAPDALLGHCISILNRGFSGSLVDEKCKAATQSVESLTPGQKAWLGNRAVRMIELTHEQRELLQTLKSCKDHQNIPPIPLTSSTKPQSCPVSILNERNSAIFCLQSEELVKNMTPLHEISQRRAVWSNFRNESPLFPAVSWLRWYLGDMIGFYFAWLHSYCLALVIPSCAGLLAWICISISIAFCSPSDAERGGEVNQSVSAFRIAYGLIVIVWALVCNKIWRRQQCQLAEDWMSPVFANVADMSGWVDSNIDQLRPAFRGELRKSPVTGEPELHFPASKRRALYAMSILTTIICALAALFVNVLLLNFEGVINSERSPYLHFRFIGCLCDPGRIFNPVDGALNFVPGILHPLAIFFVNQVVFRRVAEWLTDMENHKTQFNWDRSLIAKRFVFEAIDAYASPFYLGVIIADWDALQSFLLTTFATDSIRRLIAECLVPWLSSRVRSRLRRLASVDTEHKKSDDAPQSHFVDSKALRIAIYGVEYEPFDDFLEMVVEHGYIVLFAVACPPYLACLAFLCAWVEGFFDAFKLLNLLRRPMPRWLHSSHNVWLVMLAIQSWLALFCNLCLLARHTQWSLVSVSLLEHALIAVGLTIELSISDTPIGVINAFRKRVYERYRDAKTENRETEILS